MATFDLAAQNGATRDSQILSHATHGDLEVVWTKIMVGGRIELVVTADAVKLAGIRINVSATLQQQLADYFGAMLLTPKVADLAYAARAVTISPQPMPITSSTAGMQQESQKMDAAISRVGGSEAGDIIGTVGKHWVIDNALSQHPGMAENYGWFLPPGTKTPWQGVPVYPSVTLGPLVIQQPSWAHDPSHVDYSQQASFMHRDCKVDGKSEDLASVLQDATLGPMLSHNGPLKVLRQPGVPLYSCPSPAVALSFAMPSSATGLCPMPPAPAITEPVGWLGRNWPWLAAGTGVAAFAAALAIERR